MTTQELDKTAVIRQLNDDLRQKDKGGMSHAAGELAQRDEAFIQKVRDAVRKAVINTGDGNDPHSEHDFGSVTVDGNKYLWKIDYYDLEMNYASEDPADPNKTTRVLTIFDARDY